jgi:hypothetical protein
MNFHPRYPNFQVIRNTLPHLQSGLPTDCCVYRPWKSVSINVQSLSSFTVYCQDCTIYQRMKATARRAMYVLRNIEGRSCKHCCSGRTINITLCECVFLCSLSFPAWAILSHVAFPVLQYFFHIVSKTARFSKKLLNTK